MRDVLLAITRRRRLLIVVQLAFVAVLLGFFFWAFGDVWRDAAPLLRDADPAELALGCLFLAAYYLAFVLPWLVILREHGIRVSYAVALQAEMASMLAKYVPGGIWTPAARVVWLRKAGGVQRTSVVVSSILLEAGLSAVAGVLVFVASLLWVDGVDAPLLPLIVFGVGVAGLLHPRVFAAVARRLFRPFGAGEPPRLRWSALLGLLAYYAGSWLLGGVALLYLVRAVGGDVGFADVPFLGGTAAVGAIVAVLAVLAPSGLGVREASMYGLLLAVTSVPVALGATVVNRLAITLVEAVLLGLGALLWRVGGSREPPQGRSMEEEPAAGDQSTESKSTTNTSGSCGLITPPAPRAP